MRPCSLFCCARATESSMLWRRSFTHGSRLLSSYETPSLSGRSAGTPTSSIENHADRTRSRGWTRSQSNPPGRSRIHDQTWKRNRTPSVRTPKNTSNELLEGSGEYFEALQSSADALPRPEKSWPSPPKDLLKAAQALAQESGRQGVPHELLVRDALLMSFSLYREQGEPPAWSRNIHTLHTLIHSGESNFDKWGLLRVRDWETVAAWVQELTGKGDGPTAYNMAWKKLPLEQKRERWADIMLWLLLDSPSQALMFLRATANTTPGPPFSVVSDAFHYLSEHHYRQPSMSEPMKQQFEESVLHCLHPRTWPALGTSQNGLRLYFRYCSQSSLSTVFHRELYRRKIFVSIGILFYLADRFTRANDTHNALLCLQLAYHRRGTKPRSFDYLLHKRCCKLLLVDEVSEGQGGRDFKVLRGILDIGVKLNRSMYNIVLANALQIGDHQLAWDIYGLMDNEGPGADSYTYLALLDDALWRGDTESAGYVLNVIKANPHFRTQKQLTSKKIHAVRTLSKDVLSERWTYADTFSAMLELYSEFHDRQPLVDLGMIAPEEDGFARRDGKSTPSAHTLTIMISAFVKAQSDAAVIRHVFNRFYRLILDGHPSIAPLAETDHTWNAFLTGMAGHAGLLNDCVKVFETMLRPFEEEVTLKGDGRIIHKATPTVQTWTILLSCFLWCRQPRTALTVRDMMLKRGVKFNQVSWNVMIRGFASMQMVDETAAALMMMENENWLQDEYTLKAVSMIHDQERLRWALEKLDKEYAAKHDTDPQLQEAGHAASADCDADFPEPGLEHTNSDTEAESPGMVDSTAQNIDSSANMAESESAPTHANALESPQSDHTSPDTNHHRDVCRELRRDEQSSQTTAQ